MYYIFVAVVTVARPATQAPEMTVWAGLDIITMLLCKRKMGSGREAQL